MKFRKHFKTGDEIGTCIFIKDVEPKKYVNSKTKKVLYKRKSLFKCECGKMFEALMISVSEGNTKSCGCLKVKTNIKNGLENRKHGLRYHPLYLRWNNIIQRCKNPKCHAYKNYGGRGIKVCERWQDVGNFIKDMYPTYVEGSHIDRIDNNGDYNQENCRWISIKVNNNNKRNNRIIEYKGISKTLPEWSEYLDISYYALYFRLMRGWSLDKAFTTDYPCRTKGVNREKVITLK